MLVTASKSADGTYLYNPVTVVLLIEALKLTTSVVLHAYKFELQLPCNLKSIHRAAMACLTPFPKWPNTSKALSHPWNMTIFSVTSIAVFLLYFVPAALYCLYNNLAYVCLRIFDPTSYLLLLQCRIAITGVVFQVPY